MLTTDPIAAAVTDLRRAHTGPVVLPGEDGYDDARRAWNLAVDQHPVLVATPHTDEDVALVVRFAAAAGLRVAVQATGHGAGPRGDLTRAVLVRTETLRGVAVDPAARTARVRAGDVWLDVIEAAAPHGLAPVAGSAPDVGVVGYTLGGGLGWLGRRYGVAANSVRSIDVVTATGERVRCDADHRPELFWALRGGGGSFGVVVGMEFALHPAPEVFAGAMFFDLARAADVLGAWRALTATVPTTVSTTFKLLRLPPVEAVPAPLRGRAFAVIMAAMLESPEAGAAYVAPLRLLGPEIDTFAPVGPAALAHLAMDPPGPMPSTATSVVLDELTDEAVTALLATVGPGAETVLPMVELRQLGGALQTPPEGAGATGAIPGSFQLFAAGALTPELAGRTHADLDALDAALAPWDSGRRTPNFVERPADPRAAFRSATWARLRAVRDDVDPEGRFLGAWEVA